MIWICGGTKKNLKWGLTVVLIMQRQLMVSLEITIKKITYIYLYIYICKIIVYTYICYVMLHIHIYENIYIYNLPEYRREGYNIQFI